MVILCQKFASLHMCSKSKLLCVFLHYCVDLHSILPGRVLSFRHYSFKLGFTKSKYIKWKSYSNVYREKCLYFHEGLAWLIKLYFLLNYIKSMENISYIKKSYMQFSSLKRTYRKFTMDQESENYYSILRIYCYTVQLIIFK